MKHKGLIIVMLSLFTLTGCVYVNEGKGDERNGRTPRNAEPTIGQELLDLDRARASGVISDSEYERVKEAILDDIN